MARRSTNRRPKRKLKPFFKFSLLAGVIFGVFFAIGAGAASLVEHGIPNPFVSREAEAEPKEEVVNLDGPRVNLLILGTDARAGESNSRSDMMMLASIDPKQKKVALVSIPRDTKATIKGNSSEKICTANYYGGPEYAVDVVEDIMGLSIDNYILMDFNGFKNVVDVLGGVEVNVPQRMYKPTEDIDLQPGLQKLNGYDSLGYVRFRDYTNGDIDRTKHQQIFLSALAKEIMQPSTIARLPQIAKELFNNIHTNMSIGTMLKMASWVSQFDQTCLVSQTLPGSFYNEFNEYGELTASFWLVNKNEAKRLVDNMFAGQTLAVFQTQPAQTAKASPSKNAASTTGTTTNSAVQKAKTNDNNKQKATTQPTTKQNLKNETGKDIKV